MMALLSFGVARKVRIYEVFVEGARDGFQVALKIIPYLVAILVAVAMLRASGALEIIVSGLSQSRPWSACRPRRSQWRCFAPYRGRVLTVC